MGVLDELRRIMSLEPFQPLPIQSRTDTTTPLADQLARIRQQSAARPWRLPSIAEALEVPAIQRAVVLISNTIGRLPIEAYRSGAVMSDPPRVAVRPNPFQTPRDFYRETGWNLATRGETVWWIATRDVDGIASALVVVPPAELTVEDNPRNRLFPLVTWGNVRSTWYSPAFPQGDFVQIVYAKESGELRGKGPLQMGQAALSVSVEAQQWAANFYADGGNGGTIIKVTGALGQTKDVVTDSDGELVREHEADRVRAQWVNKPNNVPRVIDDGIESVTAMDVNPQGAQMLDAREHQNGDAARLFGIPGALMEYAQSGTSLTYQNIADVWREFQESCLTPNYLSPIEQAMSDLLTRSTTARFSLTDLLRADPKTRAEIYQLLITLGVMTPEQAAQSEGFAPGARQFAPVPPSQPNSVPSSIPQPYQVRTEPAEFRCTGQRLKRMNGVTRLAPCNALLARSGSFVGECRRCGKAYPEAA